MKYLLNKATSIEAIADAIREKLGTEESMTVAEMPNKIASISAGQSAPNTYLITINAEEDCTIYRCNTSTTDFGSFQEAENKNIVSRATEAFSSHYQVILRITKDGETFDAVVIKIQEFEEEASLINGEYYPAITGNCIIASAFFKEAGYDSYYCKPLIFVADDASLEYGST